MSSGAAPRVANPASPVPSAKKTAGLWRLAVDTGGTFTDCVAIDPAGRLRRAKVLSTSALRGRVAERLGGNAVRLDLGGWSVPDGFFRGFALRLLGRAARSAKSDPAADLEVVASEAGGALRLAAALPPDELAGQAAELRSPEEAPILAARLLTATPPGQPLPPLAMRLATTRGTNALLERKGAAAALFITRGFADLPRIGTQQRPELFALAIARPEPLYCAVVEVSERLAADGSVLAPLDLEALGEPARALLAGGVRSAAVALLHSYRNPRHEVALGAFLRHLGFRHVALSAELAPRIKLLPRTETAVVEAYLAPVLGGYLEQVAAALPAGSLHVMTSAGGLVRADAFRAKDGLLSGPAGGVVGAARAASRSGFARVIAFDMGGTSTDVARYDGDFEYLFEHRVGAAHLVAPALAIESVAAGGGSICAFDGSRLRVGPESAGAHPGPACYGAGGPLTLTDVNLLLGRLDPGRFEIPLAAAAAVAAGRELLERLSRLPQPQDGEMRREEILSGLLDIANERMAEAIRAISLRRGYDPAGYALVAFGGAGGQHACAVAELLGIATVVVPADASLLSALGLGEAAVERFAQRQVLAPLDAVGARIEDWLRELGGEASAAVAAEGVPEGAIQVRRRILNLRFAGQETTLPVEVAGARDPSDEIGKSVEAAFAAAYRQIYGYSPERRAIELESIQVAASSPGGFDAFVEVAGEVDGEADDADGEADEADGEAGAAGPTRQVRTWCGGRWRAVAAFERARLRPGVRFAGPALVCERHTTTVVEEGWSGELDPAGALVLRRSGRGVG